MTVQKDAEGNERKNLLHYADLKQKKVLEIGCGDGRLTWKYAKLAQRVLGMDLDTPALRIARIETPADMRLNVNFIRGDSIQLPVRSNSFDIAILAWSL